MSFLLATGKAYDKVPGLSIININRLTTRGQTMGKILESLPMTVIAGIVLTVVVHFVAPYITALGM